MNQVKPDSFVFEGGNMRKGFLSVLAVLLFASVASAAEFVALHDRIYYEFSLPETGCRCPSALVAEKTNLGPLGYLDDGVVIVDGSRTLDKHDAGVMKTLSAKTTRVLISIELVSPEGESVEPMVLTQAVTEPAQKNMKPAPALFEPEISEVRRTHIAPVVSPSLSEALRFDAVLATFDRNARDLFWITLILILIVYYQMRLSERNWMRYRCVFIGEDFPEASSKPRMHVIRRN